MQCSTCKQLNVRRHRNGVNASSCSVPIDVFIIVIPSLSIVFARLEKPVMCRSHDLLEVEM